MLRGRLLKASELVAQEMLLDIVERDLGAGERLPQESEMIRSYGVGRSTIREALRILEVAGLVQMRSGPQGGPRVRHASPADFGRMASLFLQAQQITLGEILTARQLLESAFTRDATLRQDPGFLERVEDLRRRGDEVDVRDDDAYLEVTGAFHVLLADASSNRVLSAVAQALISMFVGDLDRDIFPARDRRRLLDEHQEVLDAILAGDADRAESAMAAHMDHLVQGIERRQPSAFDGVIRWR
jgi:GntR family transcriptional regulator, transcriptional repressor for pyruvate dehydrogenase complex